MYQAEDDRYDRMQYRRCGESGLKLPVVSLGFWHNFGSVDQYENMRSICHAAFDNGVTHFDLANNYGPNPGSAEENLGRLLRDDFAPYRDELIISTKAGYTMWPGPYGDGGSKKYLCASLDQSLKRMGIPYVDIFYHHRMDPETPLAETMEALAQIVKSGKALYAGLSNYDGETMVRAAGILQELHCPFVINQNKYNIFDRTVEQNGLLECTRKLGKGLITFSPLEQGLLTDRYLNGIPEDSRIGKNGPFLRKEHLTDTYRKQIQALKGIADQRGETIAEMALAWLAYHPGVTSVLVGASRPEQLMTNLKINRAAPFTREELVKINAIQAGQTEG